jgi:hypothetical protein
VTTDVKQGGILTSRKLIRLLGGRHELLPCISHLDERDLVDAIKYCIFYLFFLQLIIVVPYRI